jgi:uncharacterized protein with GYD domain
MPTYITLVSWTEQGVKAAKESPKRARDFEKLAAKVGAKVKAIYWTAGRCDLVTICEAPDHETIGAVNLAVSMLGNVRSETMRAYSASEMEGILKKIP